VNASRNGWRYRATVASRAVAAAGGGYLVAALFAAATARLLPGSRVEAVLPGTIGAFLMMPAVAIWSFLASTAGRAWIGILSVSAIMAVIILVAGPPA
jgi:UDP-N-acetylenolpyruvoylglucosamine reductase